MDATVFAECITCYGCFSKTIPLERAIIVVPEKEEKKQERDSTTFDKKIFLDYLERSRGMITVVCQKTNTARSTYYHWRKTDNDFREKADDIIKAKPEILEDRLFAKAVDGDVPSLKFMISHLHPDYKRKVNKDSVVHIYHHVDKKPDNKEKPFSEMIWEEAKKRRTTVDSIKKEFEGMELPLKPDGSIIADDEIYFYERYIKDWFKFKKSQGGENIK